MNEKLKTTIYELWSISRTALSTSNCTRYDRLQYVKQALQKYNADLIINYTPKQLWLSIGELIQA